VITKIDGSPVAKTADLFRVLDRRRIGDTVELEVVRSGNRRSVKLTLEVAR
jgi:S1-C subfamily serine protease